MASVTYENGASATGSFCVEGFTALTRERYLVSAPLNAFTAVSADTAAFARTAGSCTGTGAVYFKQIPH